MKQLAVLFFIFQLTQCLPAVTVDAEQQNLETIMRDKRKLESGENLNLIDAKIDDSENDVVRSKKQAMLMGMVPKVKTSCGTMEDMSNEAPGQKNVAPLLLVADSERKAKTIDPIYSYGPLTVLGGSNTVGYGSNLRPQSDPTPFSLQALMPYNFIHHHPLMHHTSVAINRPPSKYEQVLYDVPESIYVLDTPIEETKRPALYCQPVADQTEKAIKPPVASKSNDSETEQHIKRVNEIKEEIMTLNEAARRIVQQQDEIARLQKEQFSKKSSKESSSAAAAASSSPNYYSQRPPYPAYPYHYKNMEPMDMERSYGGPPFVGPYSHPHFPPALGPHYGYGYGRALDQEAEGAAPKRSNAANFPASEEDMDLFMKLIDVAKRMGNLSRNFPGNSQSKQSTGTGTTTNPVPNENDSLKGRIQNTTETLAKVTQTEATTMATKKDRRSLIIGSTDK